ncbi:hypothetical protein [Maricaulis sp. CAU 1757]
MNQSNVDRAWCMMPALAGGLAMVTAAMATAQVPTAPDTDYDPDRRSAVSWDAPPYQQGAPRDDLDNARANAAVAIVSGNRACQGILVRSDLVLTVDRACGLFRPGAAQTVGQWSGLRSDHPVEVRLGRDVRNPRAVVQATHINRAGVTDLALLALAEPIAPNIARPRGVLTEMPASIAAYPGPSPLDDSAAAQRRRQVTAAGERLTPAQSRARDLGWQSPVFEVPLAPGAGMFGAGARSAQRRITRLNRPVMECESAAAGLLCATHPVGMGPVGGAGDAGAALTFAASHDNAEGVAGVWVGSSARGPQDFFIPTWLDTPPNTSGQTQRDWLQANLRTSLCTGLKRSRQAGNRGFAPLALWWSPGRGDNFSTSDPQWAGCPGEQRDGYVWVGEIGEVFHPAAQPGPGLVPLFHWYSPGRGDNFLTTDPRWAGERGDRREPDYIFVGRAGYIYPPDRPAPAGTLALWSWWSPSRQDNYATTLPQWDPSSGTSRAPDYRFYRLEGYVLDPDRAISMDLE